jgi:hypothetical protein
MTPSKMRGTLGQASGPFISEEKDYKDKKEDDIINRLLVHILTPNEVSTIINF